MCVSWLKKFLMKCRANVMLALEIRVILFIKFINKPLCVFYYYILLYREHFSISREFFPII